MLPSRLLKLSASLLIPLVTLFFILQQQPATASAWESKVDPMLVEAYRSRDAGEVEMIIRFTTQADLSEVAGLPTKAGRGQAVFETLTAVATTSQAELRQLLDAQNLPYKSFAVANALWVRAPAAELPTLAQREDVAYILANPRVAGDLPQPLTESQARSALAIAWGVDKINAPLVWSSGVTGTGIVIGGQDTGYNWDHPALKNQYRGWDGNSADHNYSWHDAISSDLSGNSTNPCGYTLTVPCDDNGHGTHTMGTMVGDDGQGMQIGVAPGAKWIACRNMEQGYGTPATYLECFNWFLAPTDLNGLNPMPTMAPHVINNSWACTLGEGCDSGNYSVMDTAINNLRAAGIVVVASAGNYGPSCETVRTPAAIYEGAFTIGNTQSTDVVNASSSRGPVMVDGSERMKPNVMAPGTSIPSAYLNNGYVNLTGTSMSGPHVAGALALLMAAQPALLGNVEGLETLLETTAVPSPPPQTCGDDTLSSIPNNVYGHGRIDVYAAYQSIVTHTLSLEQSVSATAARPSDQLTYTLQLSHGEAPSGTTQIQITQTLPTGTSLITTTQPVTVSGDMLNWQFATLAPTATLEVSFTVQISPTGTPGAILLPPTTFSSADVALSTSGGNLSTIVLLYYQYLPVILKPEQ